MRTFDYSPFYRATVGFDRVFDLLDSVASQSGSNGYPPYNIERTAENEYRISVAVAGFTMWGLSRGTPSGPASTGIPSGPVLAVMSFTDGIEGAAKLANSTIYGLAAGIWSRDIKKAHRAAKSLRAGTVWINTYNMFDAAAPFGGIIVRWSQPAIAEAFSRS